MFILIPPFHRKRKHIIIEWRLKFYLSTAPDDLWKVKCHGTHLVFRQQREAFLLHTLYVSILYTLYLYTVIYKRISLLRSQGIPKYLDIHICKSINKCIIFAHYLCTFTYIYCHNNNYYTIIIKTFIIIRNSHIHTHKHKWYKIILILYEWQQFSSKYTYIYLVYCGYIHIMNSDFQRMILDIVVYSEVRRDVYISRSSS